MSEGATDILQDPSRLEKLRSLNLLDHASDATFDRFTRFTAKLLKVSVALVTLIDADRQVFKSQVGLGEPWATRMETPLTHSFCQYAVINRQPFIVNDALQHPLVKDNPAVQALGIQAYAGIPLITGDGFALGALCAIHHQPHDWTDDELDTLNEIALSVMTEIELRGEIIENVKSAANLSAADMILTQERNLLRQLIDTLPMSVFVKDAQARYLLINQRHASLSGFSEAALIGKTPVEIYPDPTLARQYYEDDMAVIRSGVGVLDREERLYYPDKTPDEAGWCLTSKIPVLDAHGQVTRLVGFQIDITDRKKSEAALRASQMQLAAAISNAPLILFMLDPNGIITLFEGRALESVGFEPGAWIGLSLLDLVREMPPEAGESVIQALSGESLTTTVMFGEHTFEVRYSPIFDEAGDFMGTIGVATDITEGRQAEAALRVSQQQFEAAVTSAPLIFYALDANGIFTICEGKGLELLGLKRGELVGKSLYELFQDDEALIQRNKFALEGETFSTLVQADHYYFDTTHSPIMDEAGHTNGTIVVALDVTERVNAEAALQDSIEQLKTLRRIEAELNATLDVNQVLLFGLDVATRVSGAEHGFIGLIEGDVVRLAKPLGQYAGFTSFPVTHGLSQRVLQTKQPIWLPDVNQDPDYERDIPNTVALILLPLVRHGRLIGMMDLETSHADFFDAKTFEFLKLVAARLAVALENAQLYGVTNQQLTELQELYGRVSYLERLKTDMIRIAAHDLRNPLTAIMGMTELLLEHPETLSTDQIEFMRDIDKAARQMYKMTGDILSIQRIEQSAQQWQPVNLVVIVQGVYENARPRATRKQQTFELRIPSEPVLVRGDDAQLREAIDNLISNAIKYTPEGGKVSVRLRAGEGPLGQQVVFEVEDTGYGIPENQQARLFQPFYRAKTAETRQIEGTGLGLHLVKNIVERHMGQLYLNSVYGKGSTFGFTLKVYHEGSQPPSLAKLNQVTEGEMD